MATECQALWLARAMFNDIIVKVISREMFCSQFHLDLFFHQLSSFFSCATIEGKKVECRNGKEMNRKKSHTASELSTHTTCGRAFA
jgi:hypothetical protein